MTTKAAGVSPEPLKYQTWNLKVPIHCEGCKKKVKRVLQSIDGVFTISIDSQLHKVIVTGDVDSETLVKKLVRSGKQAELWPEDKPKDKKKAKKSKGEGQELPSDDKPDHKGEKPAENGAVGNGESKDNDDDEGENSSSEGDEKGGEVQAAGGGGGGGAGKKKKKKKKKKKNNTDAGGQDAQAGNLAPVLSSDQVSTNNPIKSIPKDQIFHPYIPTVQFPPLAAYGMSYNPMYHPSGNNTLHYAYPMHDPRTYSQPGLYWLPPPLEPIDNYLGEYDDDYYDYDDYDDEGGCSIM